MKLQNKKTGEIGYLENHGLEDERLWIWIDNVSKPEYRYNSLSKLNEEWEDYEEPKEYWYIYGNQVLNNKCDGVLEDRFKEIGNYFETREEAEKAVEKLKAWKRLKDSGFRFAGFGWSFKDKRVIIHVNECQKSLINDMDLLFGGEE